jgi:LL-diaminopimelate aminotransferase
MTTQTKRRFVASRLDKIPPYLFAEIDKKRLAAIEKGVDIINLGIGDPDKPTPAHIVAEMHQAIDDPSTHNYPPYAGTKEFREAAVKWFTKRFDLSQFNPDTECVGTIGMKEALHNLFLATVDPGDYTLIPDPGYPVYKTSTILCGGTPYFLPLKEENDFLIDLDSIPEEIARKAKILVLNYPNNPTGAFANLEFFKKVIAFGKKYEILIVHDNAYSENSFDQVNKPPSIFQVEGARDIAIELFSMSKGYNMTGWRIGFAVGNVDAIKALSNVKTNIDSGVFKAIQKAAVHALSSSQDHLKEFAALYQERAKVAEEGLKSLGWDIKHPSKGTLYIWQKIPPRYKSSMDFAADLLEKTGIIVPPGVGYGQAGEGYFRIALSVKKERIQEAIERMKTAGLTYNG